MRESKVIQLMNKPKKVIFRSQEQITEMNRKKRKEMLDRFDSQSDKKKDSQ